ncbi:ABC transporter permease subunit [Clostridium sp. 'White wine YQ']|uniref:ABC transporter permease subunit n=1 Tax=Clostridium sp. 'White wine YQ' TaxID=3027474 RepID=UPI002367227A|nr:ABC transporter permease subunit [Clostridium sp. 'White wine YQ']MDD7795150.1 M28 family peptidase [Clostridium sp. 'White wine YQ']
MLKWVKGFGGFFLLILIMVLVAFSINKHSFQKDIFTSDNIYKNTDELSKIDTNDGQVKYLEKYFKDIGLEPAGENGTYYQNFKTMVPIYNSSPELSLRDRDNKVIKSFKYGEDFRETLTGSGGVGNVNSKLYLLQGDIESIPKEILQNYIILSSVPLSDSKLEYVAQSGGKAVIFPGNGIGQKNSFDMQKKNGKSILIYTVTQNVFQDLSNSVGMNLNGYLNVDVSFKMQDTPNVLGMIQGSDKTAGYLIVSSHIDEDASGIAMLMEQARTLKMQKYSPKKTIIFAVWNSFNQGMKGSKYYVNNPLFPLEKTQVLVFNSVGERSDINLIMSTDGSVAQTIMNKLAAYCPASGIAPMMNSNIYGTDGEEFFLNDIPAIVLSGDKAGNANFDINKVSSSTINGFGDVLLSYIQREVYGDWYHGLFNGTEQAFILIIIAAAIVISVLKKVYRLKPRNKSFEQVLETIYYSSAFSIIDKVIQILIVISVATFFISFLAYTPKSFDIVSYGGEHISNYPIYNIAHNAILFIREFLTQGFGKTLSGFSITYIISFSIIKSLGLILSSLILAFFIGTLIGTLSSFKNKNSGNAGFLLPVAVLSLPDVFVAVCIQLGFIYLRKNNIISTENSSITQFLLPLLCLAIIPTAYISRVAQVAVKEEINKDYIVAAKAKGLSTFSILKDHLLISVVIKIIETLPSVLTIIMSNVIVVEYLFGYTGIVYQLFSYFKDGDIWTCICLVIGIGIVYFILNMIFKILSIIVNPFKRGNILGGNQNEKA